MTQENKTEAWKDKPPASQEPYRLVELVGSGGMANVYRAIQVSLEREVAVKRLHPYLIQNQNFLARFQKEAKAAASLRHENLVSVIDYGQDSEGYFIVMEYVRGKTLREVLEQGSVPLEVALVIATKVALGLAFCHQSGVVHRDVKPANILLSEEGEVKLADFGIAKGQDTSITITGTTLGSPAYMAPEQLRSQEVDRRTDIFSLGIVLYEMLAGKKPFDGDNYSAVITSILTGEPTPLCEIVSVVPPKLSLLAAQMLEKDPDRRVSRMEEVNEKLEELLRYYGVRQKHELLKKFLAAPEKFSEEAQSQRVKRHLDSGIYYFHLGRGKIADAKREFAEALRWDAKNQMARDYLERLSAEPTESFENNAPMQEALNRRLFPYGLAFIFFLGFFLYSGFGVLETATRRFEVEQAFKKKKAQAAWKATKGMSGGSLSPGQRQLENGGIFSRNQSDGTEESDSDPNSSAVLTALPAPRTWIQFGYVPPGEESYLVISAKREAYVNLDGKALGKVPPPRTFKIAAGGHTVVYSYPGFKNKIKNLELKPKQTKALIENLRLERK